MNERRATGEENRLAGMIERLDVQQAAFESWVFELAAKDDSCFPVRITGKVLLDDRPTYSGALLSPNEETGVFDYDVSGLTFNPDEYPLYEMGDNPDVPMGEPVEAYPHYSGRFYWFRYSRSYPNILLDGTVHSDTELTVVEKGMIPAGTTVGDDVKWKGFPPGADHKLLESLASDPSNLNWTDSPTLQNVYVTNGYFTNLTVTNNFYVNTPDPVYWGGKRRLNLVSRVCVGTVTEQAFAETPVEIDSGTYIVVATISLTLDNDTDLIVQATILWDGSGGAISGDTFLATIRVDGTVVATEIPYTVMSANDNGSGSMGYLVPGLTAGAHDIELVAARNVATGSIFAGANSNIIVRGDNITVEKKKLDFPNGLEVISTYCNVNETACCGEDPTDGTDNPKIVPNAICLIPAAVELLLQLFNADPVAANNIVVFNLGVTGTATAIAGTSPATLTMAIAIPPATTGDLTATVYVPGGGVPLNSGAPVKVAEIKEICDPPTVDEADDCLEQAATTLVITGTNFSTTSAHNTIVFSTGVTGTVTSSTSTMLTVAIVIAGGTLGALTAVVSTNGVSSGTPIQVATVQEICTVTTPCTTPGSLPAVMNVALTDNTVCACVGGLTGQLIWRPADNEWRTDPIPTPGCGDGTGVLVLRLSCVGTDIDHLGMHADYPGTGGGIGTKFPEAGATTSPVNMQFLALSVGDSNICAFGLFDVLVTEP